MSFCSGAVQHAVASNVHTLPRNNKRPPPPSQNTQMTVGQCFERDAEGENAESYPHIRLFTVGTNASTEPLDDVAAPHQPWSVAGREVRCCGVGVSVGLGSAWSRSTRADDDEDGRGRP